MEDLVLSHLEKKETLKDVLGLFVDAQNSVRTVKQVTGGDLKMFSHMFQTRDSSYYGLDYCLLLLVLNSLLERDQLKSCKQSRI